MKTLLSSLLWSFLFFSCSGLWGKVWASQKLEFSWQQLADCLDSQLPGCLSKNQALFSFKSLAVISSKAELAEEKEIKVHFGVLPDLTILEESLSGLPTDTRKKLSLIPPRIEHWESKDNQTFSEMEKIPQDSPEISSSGMLPPVVSATFIFKGPQEKILEELSKRKFHTRLSWTVSLPPLKIQVQNPLLFKKKLERGITQQIKDTFNGCEFAAGLIQPELVLVEDSLGEVSDAEILKTSLCLWIKNDLTTLNSRTGLLELKPEVGSLIIKGKDDFSQIVLSLDWYYHLTSPLCRFLTDLNCPGILPPPPSDSHRWFKGDIKANSSLLRKFLEYNNPNPDPTSTTEEPLPRWIKDESSGFEIRNLSRVEGKLKGSLLPKFILTTFMANNKLLGLSRSYDWPKREDVQSLSSRHNLTNLSVLGPSLSTQVYLKKGPKEVLLLQQGLETSLFRRPMPYTLNFEEANKMIEELGGIDSFIVRQIWKDDLGPFEVVQDVPVGTVHP